MTDPAHEQDDPLLGTVLAGRYRVEERLGEGGMGTVYRAEHVRMRKSVAIKVLHAQMSAVSEAVFRFEREAVAAARVDHPHLVSATDFGELEDGSLYLVLEYVSGASLGSLLQEGPLDQMRALRIARQIGEALVAVHAAGIVHRDLKPDNVMVTDKDGEDFVKLLDFGMAKVQMGLGDRAAKITQAGLVFGTPRFMAPEQAAGKPADHRADLYALGVILYAMLAGAPPFVEGDIAEILRKQRYETPPALPVHVDPGVSGLVMTLLAKEPGSRVQTAEAAVGYIDALLGRLTSTRRGFPARVFRLLRSAAERPGLVAAVVIASLAAFLLSFVLARSTDETERFGESLPAASSSAPAPVVDPVLEQLFAQVEAGEPGALEALEERADAERSAREWLSLGKGRFARGHRREALEAYARAIEARPDYSKDPWLLADIRAAADTTDAWEAALQLAARLPGPEAADLLFDVWASTPEKNAITKRARELLAVRHVRAVTSPSVAIALDLREVRGRCEERQKLLSRALEHGDARSLRPLLVLTSTRGCGYRKREDCFPCLRRGDELSRAVNAARDRPAPRFSRPGTP